MSISWLNVPRTLLKLVIGGSLRTNVVSGQPSSDSTRTATASSNDLPDDSAGSQKRESSAHEGPTARKDHRLHESQVQQGHDAGQPHAALSRSSANGPTSSAMEGVTGPIRSQLRNTESAGSVFSLSSTVSTTGTTTGAYPGFTQNGQYDLTHDVILRGEFISDQQAKVYLMIQDIALQSTATPFCTVGSHCQHPHCHLHRRHNFGGCPQLQVEEGMVLSPPQDAVHQCKPDLT